MYRVKLGATTLNLEGIRLDYITDEIHIHLSRVGSLQRGGRTVCSQRNTTTQIQVLDL